MSKPIFLVGMPEESSTDNLLATQRLLEETLNDYHCLVYISNKSDIDFKCFYEKDFDKIKFEELKDIVIKSIK